MPSLLISSKKCDCIQPELEKQDSSLGDQKDARNRNLKNHPSLEDAPWSRKMAENLQESKVTKEEKMDRMHRELSLSYTILESREWEMNS